MNSTKIAEFVAIAAGLYIIYRLWQQKQAAAAPASSSSASPSGAPYAQTTPIPAAGTAAAAGWTYLGDGTVIAPNGAWFVNGVQVLDPLMSFGDAATFPNA